MALLAYWKQLLGTFIALLIFFAGYHLRAMQDDLKAAKDMKKQYSDEKKLQDLAYNESDKYEKRISAFDIRTQTLYNQLNEAINENNSYKCTIPTDGLRIINKAIN